MSRPRSSGASSPAPDRRLAAPSARAARGRAPGAARLAETPFQQRITDAATLFGWRWYHTYDSRHSVSGWLDLTLLHRARRLLWFREVKAEDGEVSDAQQEWIDDLVALGHDAAVWRPSDWPRILQQLCGDLTRDGRAPRTPASMALPPGRVKVRLIGAPEDLVRVGGGLLFEHGDERVSWDGKDAPARHHPGAVCRYLDVQLRDPDASWAP